jgi:hypothetical protein
LPCPKDGHEPTRIDIMIKTVNGFLGWSVIISKVTVFQNRDPAN